jgi:hypothetical protein
MTHQNDTGEKPQEGDEVAKSTRAITRFCADLKSGKASMMYETRENVEIYLLKGDDLDLLHDHIRTLIRAAEENAGLRAELKRLYYEAIEPIATLGNYHGIHNPLGVPDGYKAVELAIAAHDRLEKVIDRIERGDLLKGDE